MTELVPRQDIETIVGVTRHHSQHWGRAVSKERTVYILHSQECLDEYNLCTDSGVDLRDCPYSLALDEGIELEEWIEDLPVQLRILGGRIMPTNERRCAECGCVEERACEGGCYWVSPTLCSGCAP